MPKSKVRKKAVYTPPKSEDTPKKAKAVGPSHPAYIAVMLGLIVLGIAWMVVYYLAEDRIQFIGDLGSWNLLIGFAAMIGGLLMTMKWR